MFSRQPWGPLYSSLSLDGLQHADPPLHGKERINGSGQYIRQAGSDKIYLIPEPLIIYSEADDWLRKDLLALESKHIKRFDLQKGDNSSFSISRIDDKSDWVNGAENSELIEKNKIKKALSRLEDLTFSKLKWFVRI